MILCLGATGSGSWSCFDIMPLFLVLEDDYVFAIRIVDVARGPKDQVLE
jgi:hypothetical protein